MATTDRDLLLAVLAVQTGFVTQDVLLAALHDNRAGGERSVRSVLRERQGLSEHDLSLLEALADIHLRLHGNNLQQCLAAFPPGLDFAQFMPPTRLDLGATLNTLGFAPTTAAPPRTEPGSTPPPSRPAADAKPRRFRILRSHARGGLGEVFVARDEELQREVALKEIQQRHALHAESRARFVLEAELTGRLEHPGIVPVYGLGCYDDGRPYYAMRFIKGDSLEEAIRRYHQPDPAARTPGKQALELRKLLRRFLGVCDAIAYAHSRDVLHRDLKPANVMLGPYGETLVVDWGLAKQMKIEECRLPMDGGDNRPATSDNQQSTQTQAGAVMGTPAFMSPEQATGDLDALGPASDVYSLGATLYCLISGKTPFEGLDLAQTLERVRQGRFPGPRAVNAAVPAALEAICLKAMALRPGDRYPSARALADDLEHWLADEPVTAYPESWRMRASRWRRHHQTLVSAATALCATAMLALAIGYTLLIREQGRTRRAESDRVGVQVQALLDANSQSVPALLDGLEPFRVQVTPRLRELVARHELEERRLVHARLALLREDREQLSFLRTRLTDPGIDPEEMLMLCEVLAPYRGDLTADLWAETNRAGIDPRQRFRCLVALAQFDPDNPRWPAVAHQAVEPLLRSDPLRIGSWTNALLPVRAALTEPLGSVFRDKARPAERRVAASILQEYAADRPELLADLIADADEYQFALLFPRLEPHRAAAVAFLRRELARTLSPGWEDGPSRADTEPDSESRREVEAAEGMLTERFALCQTLPLERLPAVSEALGRSGYRPTRVRPFLAGATMRASVVWLRDGRPWRALQGVSAEDIRKKDEEFRRLGFRPVDVAGYRTAGERYVALWGQPADPTDDVRLLVGVPLPEQKKAIDSLQTAGLLPRTCQVMPVPENAARYSAVWGLAASAFEFKEIQAMTAAKYKGQLTIDRLLLDVSLTAAPDAPGEPLRPRYTTLWQYGGAMTAVEVHGLNPQAHLARCRTLAEQGYRPASLSAIEMEGATVTASVWHRPVVPEAALESLARRQANAAAALLRLGDTDPVWPLLQHHGPDPRRRTYLVHRLGPLGVNADLVARRLEVEPDESARRALILSLGVYTPEQLGANVRERLLPRLLEWYRDDPDPGIHGATGWLLRHGKEGPEPRRIDWGQADALQRMDAAPAVREPGKRRWYVNGEGQTMTVVPGPVEFTMGSPYQAPQRRAPEMLHRRRIDRSFALATTPVTAGQFQKFMQDHRDVRHPHPREYAPAPTCPAMNLNWYECAQYCRWLSEQEHVQEDQMCYPSVAELEKCKDGKLPVKLPPNVLSRTGYRLPTEAEWEFACRANAETTRFFGHSEEMLGPYAWYAPNSRDRTWPVGQKMPNDLGLFDMQGHVWQWCHNEYLDYPPGRVGQPAEDEDKQNEVLGEGSRALRGGTFFLHGSSLRSAFRQYDRPTYVFLTFGFRVARTVADR